MRPDRLAKYAWGVLGYNILVVLWGAFVRATGSGAGCGNHWPLCNGVVVPRSPQLETVIEFSHRLSSGLAILSVIALILWAFRSYPKGHPARLGATLSLLFMVTEALVGAGLVLFNLVAGNASAARAISVSIHLVNTFLLLASITLTAHWATGGAPIKVRGQGALAWTLAAGIVGMLILGVSGALTALGDTLFKAHTLTEGISQDFAPTAHFLIRLRLFHPLIAVATSALLIIVGSLAHMLRPGPAVRRPMRIVAILAVVQLGAGALNVILLAPVWLQLVHLLLADLVWVTFILLAASALAPRTADDSSSVPASAPLGQGA